MRHLYNLSPLPLQLGSTQTACLTWSRSQISTKASDNSLKTNDLNLQESIAVGRSKISRLLSIAHCNPLAGPALTLALSAITAYTLDVTQYEHAYQQYRNLVNGIEKGDNKDPDAVAWYQSVKGREVQLDRAWMDRARREAKSGLDRLEVELKGYTTNLIKESTRACSFVFPP